MSEPKLISPMLDNFVMGDPISEHHGVQCCPAMEKDTEDKYIVKIISVPASKAQLDALLLSGAYSDQVEALNYFSSLAEGITQEVNILKKLSELEGYLPIDACQTELMADGTGFDVYLLSKYHKTLARQLRQGSLTHLSALNLGLDLCAALAIARRTGYLYVNLKPGNIYLSTNNSYRIGDVGFLKLDSLKYTSLPDRYHSAYTAPEIADAFSDLNTTIDVYALGLILYQVFNDGNLPFKEDTAPAQAFPAPAYADYEMAEIILKACAPNPADRWQDPIAFGQALVSYMQRNGAHDTPIVPVAEPEPETAPKSEAAEIEAEVSYDENGEIAEASIFTEDDEGNLTFLEGQTDETMEAEDAAEIDYEDVSGEVSDMLLQADDLIAHEAPEPVVQPEAIDVPIPPPLPIEEPAAEETDAEQVEAEAPTEEMDAEEESAEEESDVSAEDDFAADDMEAAAPKPKRKRGFVVGTILVILLAAIIAAGAYFYKVFYIQNIDGITLEAASADTLTVHVVTEADYTELSVVCTDTYGNQLTSPVENGIARFTNLTANCAYNIKVVTNGFHHLTGNTTAAYTTPNLTEITQLTAVTGADNGSVILSFTVTGPDSENWIITYTADDGAAQTQTFTGHMLTVNGLTVGNTYSFTLAPEAELHIKGENTVEYTAAKVIAAQNLMITQCEGTVLSASWSAGSANVNSWTVRCYNDTFDETIVIAQTAATFTIPDDKAGYTVEVTAAGMSVSQRTLIGKDPYTVTDFTVDDSNGKSFEISWKAAAVPTDGFVLTYSADGSVPKQVLCNDKNKITVSPVVPSANYSFALQTASGEAVLGGTKFFTTHEAQDFSGYKVSASEMEFKMCLTPDVSGWDRFDLSDSDYTTDFKVGEKASFLVKLSRSARNSKDSIETMFVIRDENGTILSMDTSTRTWSDMWTKSYCELDIPALPQEAGKYTVSTYFNGAFVNETSFNVLN